MAALLISGNNPRYWKNLGNKQIYPHAICMNSSILVGKNAPLPKLPQTFPSKIDSNLALGLDLGVGSCGQALVYDKTE